MKAEISLVAGATDRIALMETYVCIVEAGSLSAAAQRMGSTQPTISRRLQSLERLLGIRLIHRSTHALRLTDDGQRCYEQARELLAGWQTFESEMQGLQDEPSGLLRVVAPHAFGQQALVDPTLEYLQRHPKLQIEWLLHDRPPDFMTTGIDCAIQIGEVRDPSVVAVHLGEVPRIVVAAPALLGERPWPADPGPLAGLPWLALQTYYRNDVMLSHVETGERRRFDITPRFMTDSLYALRHAARLGMGAGILSAWVVADDVASGALVHLASDWQASALPIYLTYPSARFYPARLRHFIAMMRSAIPRTVGMVSRHS